MEHVHFAGTVATWVDCYTHLPMREDGAKHLIIPLTWHNVVEAPTKNNWTTEKRASNKSKAHHQALGRWGECLGSQISCKSKVGITGPKWELPEIDTSKLDAGYLENGGLLLWINMGIPLTWKILEDLRPKITICGSKLQQPCLSKCRHEEMNSAPMPIRRSAVSDFLRAPAPLQGPQGARFHGCHEVSPHAKKT